jgi:hypothetical protein
MPPRSRSTAFLIAIAGLVWFAACKSPQDLPNASRPNVVDTLTLYSLSGTDVGTPSGYLLFGPEIVDVGLLPVDPQHWFDFAFNIDAQPVLLPSGTFPGLPNVAGLQPSTAASFNEITTAPVDGYVIDQPLVIATGTLALARGPPSRVPHGPLVRQAARPEHQSIGLAGAVRGHGRPELRLPLGFRPPEQ